jgi:hypothetical protein
MTGTDAFVGAELDFVSGLRIGLPQITKGAGILARAFYSWHSGTLIGLAALP